MRPTPRIAIVGGGPGGLTLARILHLHGWNGCVYERESHALQRPQGGSLDLHADTGLLALERAGLSDGFAAIARHDDQGSRILDADMQVLFDHQDNADGGRPEVDRTALRQLLLDALPADAVRWGHSLERLRAHPDGGWLLQFESGDVAGPFDLVVGADGLWSRVRPLLSPYQPQYSGLSFLEFGIDDVDRAHPALAALVGRGKLDVEGGGKALIVQRNGNAHLRAYAIFRVPADWMQQHFDFSAPDTLRAQLLDTFADYAEGLRQLIRASNDQFAIRPIHALPVGHCWPHRDGLTLLGDAAHVMSPFGGDGVNNSMFDAAELARHLLGSLSLDVAVSRYEQEMFARVRESAEGAALGAATFLSHLGPAHAADTYRRLIEPGNKA